MSSLIDWLVENEPLFRKTRLPSLYSDLNVQKNTNPEGYSANIAAWQAALTRAALAGRLPNEQHIVLQTSEKLLNTLANPHYGQPSGLGLVIDESVRSRKMIDLKDFLSTETSIYHTSWIPSPWSILRWGLQQAGLMGNGSYDSSGRLRDGSLVLVQALEEVSRKILAAQERGGQSMTDRIVSRESFVKDLAKLGLESPSEQEVGVLLRYLSRDKRALSYDSEVVKFKAPNASSSESITSEDHTIASLKTLITNLAAQVNTLEQRIISLQANAQNAVTRGNKQSALAALKSKKLSEKSLQQRTNTLHQLEETFRKIEEAADQVEVIQAMEASTRVLRNLNHKVGSLERVEDVVDSLREQMGKVDEVGQVLQDPLDNKTVLDEAEVDDELEEMEKEERRKQEDQEAEAVKKRLDELEVRRPEREEMDETFESSLTSSIDQLQKLSVEELNPSKEKVQQVNN